MLDKQGAEKLLESVVSATDSALAEIDRLTKERDQLATKVAEMEPIYLQKVAALKSVTPAVDADRLGKTLDTLVQSNLFPADLRTKMASSIQQDPNGLLDLLRHVSDVFTACGSAEGYGVPKSASDLNELTEDDPDGWDLVAQGKTPPLRR